MKNSDYYGNSLSNLGGRSCITWFYCWTSSNVVMFSGMGPARSCLMISRLWNQIKDGGSSGWCRRYSGLSLGSETWDILHGITCLILCYLGREAEVYWSSSDWQICWGRGRSKRITTCCLLLMPKPALAGRKALPFTDSMKKRDLLLDFRHFMNSHKRSRDGKPPLCSLSSFSLY